PGYLLRLADDSVDLARFEQRAAAAANGPSGERARLLREALAEWRGPPLPELAYEPFLQGQIRWLEELHVTAQEDLLDAELALGVDAALVPRLEALTARNPHRERLRGQLMLALYRAGRQAEALNVYQDARRALSEDLGLEPGP